MFCRLLLLLSLAHATGLSTWKDVSLWRDYKVEGRLSDIYYHRTFYHVSFKDGKLCCARYSKVTKKKSSTVSSSFLSTHGSKLCGEKTKLNHNFFSGNQFTQKKHQPHLGSIIFLETITDIFQYMPFGFIFRAIVVSLQRESDWFFYKKVLFEFENGS